MIRIGLLGASRIAVTAVIGPVAEHPAFAVTAVAARDPDRAQSYALAHDIPHVSADYEALIARDDVDLIYNGLPPAGHAAWTIAALKAGKPVLCEKPFARDAAEARAMVEAAATAGLPLIEAFHYRFHNVTRRAEALVRSGMLGKITRARALFQVSIPRDLDDLRWRADQGGGALMDLGCYPLHILRTLIGEEPVVTQAEATFVDGVDSELSGRLAFPGGAVAELSCSMTPDAPGASVVLEGEAGRLEILNFLAPQMGCRFTTTIDGETTAHPTDGPTTYQAQLAHVREVLRDGVTPLTGGADAIANMAAIDALYAAAGR
ncbi:Gfo/Idh/MocA family protein [Phenylobacterium aquaticum]|uniref:Gfo/Idh/MocA family protein n=1 Tax=Phenylobacterium aquaticum TaxID=1763816 RepID=UPI0026EB984C|nr:Gfo/Idh/MocA family oxidoreductase [Phenylobacterium aquaticum]